MGDLTAHFSRREFACNCGCGRDTIDWETLQKLEEVRQMVGAPMIITSGFRCASYNQQAGGAQNSQHLVGRAADFKFGFGHAIHLPALWDDLRHRWSGKYGLGLYNTFIHLDTRTNGGARWDMRES